MTFTWGSRFGLHRNPFKDTIDSELFYPTRQHEEVLVKIGLGFEDGQALILLAGQSGTGKTLATQMVLRSLTPASYLPALVLVYPGMGKGALLGAILAAVGAEAGRFLEERLTRLQEIALARHAAGQRLVVVIDEAHFLQADALHLLRTLSNLETENEKLVTVLLVAEDSLLQRLQRPSYAALRNRITFALQLQPMSLADMEQYIKFRLLKCGATTHLVSRDALRRLHGLTHGVPREVNRLLYNAFVEAMVGDSGLITEELVQRAGQKLGLKNE